MPRMPGDVAELVATVIRSAERYDAMRYDPETHTWWHDHPETCPHVDQHFCEACMRPEYVHDRTEEP